MTPHDFLMHDRNIDAIALEKAGLPDAAAVLYEANIKDQFDGSHPYERLRIIYSKQGKIEDALRVCKTYIESSKTHDLALKSKMADWIAKQGQ
jgi:hypothetical protein